MMASKPCGLWGAWWWGDDQNPTREDKREQKRKRKGTNTTIRWTRYPEKTGVKTSGVQSSKRQPKSPGALRMSRMGTCTRFVSGRSELGCMSESQKKKARKRERTQRQSLTPDVSFFHPSWMCGVLGKGDFFNWTSKEKKTRGRTKDYGLHLHRCRCCHGRREGAQGSSTATALTASV